MTRLILPIAVLLMIVLIGFFGFQYLRPTEQDPVLVKVYGRYNVVNFDKKYFAVPQGTEIDWKGNDVEKKPGVFVSDSVDQVVAMVPTSALIEPPILVKVVRNYNIVRYDGKYFAVPHGVVVDWESGKVSEIPGVYADVNQDTVVAAAMQPAPVVDDSPKLLQTVGHYNIVQFQAKYYAVPQGVAVDWKNDKVIELPGVFIENSLEDVVAAASKVPVPKDNTPKQLQVIGHYNIVLFQGSYFAILHGVKVDWSKGNLSEKPGILQSESLDGAIALAKKSEASADSVPHLRTTVGHFNIVQYHQIFYAIPQGVPINWEKDRVAEMPGVKTAERQDELIKLIEK